MLFIKLKKKDNIMYLSGKWKKSIMTSGYLDNSEAKVETCQVHITESCRIEVVYRNGYHDTYYYGSSSHDGHFFLEQFNGDGKATLHYAKKMLILEGFWFECGESGFWRIELKN